MFCRQLPRFRVFCRSPRTRPNLWLRAIRFRFMLFPGLYASLWPFFLSSISGCGIFEEWKWWLYSFSAQLLRGLVVRSGIEETAAAMAKLSRGQRAGAGTFMLLVLALLSLMLMIMLLLGLVAVPGGRRGRSIDDGAVVELKLPLHRHGDDNLLAPWVEVLSWEPRAFVYHHFLTQEECTHLIELARPSLVKSTVVDSATGKSKDSRVRTSSGTFLMRGQDAVIKRIEKRIADFTFIPVEQGEGLQVLQYRESEKYEAHYDYFHDAFNTKNGGQRIATVLMYLSNVEEGGETVFPASKVNSSEVPDWDKRSQCARAGISVRPRMGDALLFWSMKPDASLDPTSLHGGCPVIKGTKWSATKWLHVENYAV